MLNEKQASQNAIPPEFLSNPGNRIQPVYTRVYDEDLKREVVKHTSDTDIYELIQESNNTSDITLLKKMINGGQVEPPTDDLAQYGLDMANMPKNIHEVYDQVNSKEKAFASLPAYLQEALGSPEGMQQALLDGSYQSIVDSAISNQVKLEAAKAAAAAKGENE